MLHYFCLDQIAIQITFLEGAPHWAHLLIQGRIRVSNLHLHLEVQIEMFGIQPTKNLLCA